MDIWKVWASYLQQWGLDETIASSLEALGPLTILGAQMIYIGQPLFSFALPKTHLKAMSNMLEDSTRTRDFVQYLREATSSEF